MAYKDEDLGTLITKKDFDKYFENALTETEEELIAYHKQYLDFLTFRQQYREAYTTHRVKHYISTSGVLQFRKACKRNIGYQAGDK